MKNLEVNLWWNRLSEEEQNLLLTFLYELDLTEYFEMDNDGNISKRKK